MLAVGAVLAGARSYASIAQWAGEADHDLIVCGPASHAGTIGRVLAAVGPVALQTALTRWVLSRRTAVRDHGRTGGRAAGEEWQPVAVDGKARRGARRSDGAETQLVTAYDSADGLMLSQVEAAGGDEIAAFVPVLTCLSNLRGIVVTADALHCQRAHAAWLHARGGRYLFTAKGNQPTLHAALARLPWGQAPRLRERSRGHGRSESRSIKVIDLDGGASTIKVQLQPDNDRYR